MALTSMSAASSWYLVIESLELSLSTKSKPANSKCHPRGGACSRIWGSSGRKVLNRVKNYRCHGEIVVDQGDRPREKPSLERSRVEVEKWVILTVRISRILQR